MVALSPLGKNETQKPNQTKTKHTKKEQNRGKHKHFRGLQENAFISLFCFPYGNFNMSEILYKELPDEPLLFLALSLEACISQYQKLTLPGLLYLLFEVH